LPQSQVSGVNVTAAGPDAFFSSARTGSDGTFEIEGAPPGAVNLRANAGDVSHMRTAVKQVTINGDEPFVVGDILFEDGFALTGTVTRHNAPVSGAGVFVTQQGGGGRSGSSQTDENGGYSIP